MTLRQLPNAITLARIAMVLPLALLIRDGEYRVAFWLTLVAGASDALDGLLAKRFGWETRLGGLLDPIADKLLLASLYLGLWGAGQLPTWLVALVVGRDVVIFAGAVAYHWLIAPVQARPSYVSKATTLAQVTLVLGWLLHLALWPMPPALLDFGVGLVAGLTVVSGLDYVVRWSLKARRERRRSVA